MTTHHHIKGQSLPAIKAAAHKVGAQVKVVSASYGRNMQVHMHITVTR